MFPMIPIIMSLILASNTACSPEVSPGKNRVDPPLSQPEAFAPTDQQEQLRQIKVEHVGKTLQNLKNDIDTVRAGKLRAEVVQALDYRVQEQRAKIETLILEMAGYADQAENLGILRNRVYILRAEVENMKVKLAVENAAVPPTPAAK